MNDYTQRLKKIEAVLQKKLPFMYVEDWKNSAFGSLGASITDAHIDELVKPCRELLLLGGKRWRPLLLTLCAELAGLSCDDSLPYELTPAVELVHTASLIHDDIEDAADLRRGKPAAHITYGTDTAINAASWLYFEAFACIRDAALEAPLAQRLYELVTEQLRRLHLGQSMDISWHKKNIFPSRAEYEAMIRLKTGTLANLAAQLGILCAGASRFQAEQAGILAADIGAGFQILDDVLNLTSGNPGKKRGDDIVEGKKSLPVLLHTEKNPQDAQKIASFFAAARSKGIEAAEVEKCIHLLTKSGAVSEAKTYADTLIRFSCAAFEKTYGSSAAAGLISELFISML